MSNTETMIYDLPLKRTCEEFRRIAKDLRQAHLVCKTFGSPQGCIDYQLEAAAEWEKRADVFHRLGMEAIEKNIPRTTKGLEQ